LQHVYSDHGHRVPALCDGEWSSTEIAGVGNEGILGISLFMGGNHLQSCDRTDWRKWLSVEAERDDGGI